MKSPESFQSADQVKVPDVTRLAEEAQQSFLQRRDSLTFMPPGPKDVIGIINHHLQDNIFGSVHDRCDDGNRGGRGGQHDRRDNNDRDNCHDRDDRRGGDHDRDSHYRPGRRDYDNCDRSDSSRYDRREEQHYQGKEDRIDDATEYLKNNFGRLDRDNDGQVDRRELRNAANRANNFDERNKLRTLQENFDEIKNANRDGRDGITRGDAYMTQRDLDRNREMRGIADRLHRGHPSLFCALDGADGMEDGLISKNDLKEFKKDFFRKLVKGDLGGVYTPENMKLVGDMLNQWNHPGSAVNEMKDGDFISRRSLAESLHENRYGDHQRRFAYQNQNRYDF